MMVTDFKNYVEVTPQVWKEVELLIGSLRGATISKEARHDVDKLLRQGTRTKDKPTWVYDLPEGTGATSMIWEGNIIILGDKNGLHLK